MLDAPEVQNWAETTYPTFIPMNEISGTVRTAVSVEPRDGHLCVFIPPMTDAEDYAALIASLEEAAKRDQPTHPYRGL